MTDTIEETISRVSGMTRQPAAGIVRFGWSLGRIEGVGDICRKLADFSIRYGDGPESLPDARPPMVWVVSIKEVGRCVRHLDVQIEPTLLDTMWMERYARRIVPLGDRIRLLAYLEGASSVMLVEATTAMPESHEAVGAVIALALQRVVRIDWRLSPDSRLEAVR